jgi:hypothetical protein
MTNEATIKCHDENCGYDIDVEENASLKVVPPYIEVNVRCPKCGQNHYTSNRFDDLVDE